MADEPDYLSLPIDAPLVLHPQGEVTISGYIAPRVPVYDPAAGEYAIRSKAGERVYLVYEEEANLYVRHYPQPGEKLP
jgi:hypothetical protein